jgi:hypothetical protein
MSEIFPEPRDRQVRDGPEREPPPMPSPLIRLDNPVHAPPARIVPDKYTPEMQNGET